MVFLSALQALQGQEVQIDAMVNCANRNYQLGGVSLDMQFLHLHIWPKELYVCLSLSINTAFIC
jgi:hypothetical protein